MSHRQHVAAFFAAVASGTVPADLVADELVVWTPTSGETGSARFAAGVAALAALFRGDLVYRIDRLVEEGDSVAAEVVSTGTFADGEPYGQTHMFAFDFVDDRIVRMAEHMNTLVTMQQVVPRLRAAAAATV